MSAKGVPREKKEVTRQSGKLKKTQKKYERAMKTLKRKP